MPRTTSHDVDSPTFDAPMPAANELDEINDLSPEPDEPPQSGVDVSALATAIVGAVNAAQGPRKIKSAEYMRTRSVHRNKPELRRKYFQNGMLLTRRQLTAEAINLLNQIEPGAYANDVVVVPVRDGDAVGRIPSLDIRYASKDVDQRMRHKSLYPTFEHLLKAILRERSLSVSV